ncbi:MAG: S46 family peptidase [Bacteroidota bacterium]|nr:S46 family peptidase [Bacteroidota bacterium]
MKKIALVILILLSVVKVKADEGMWLVTLLGQEQYNKMVAGGLKLTKEQLYDINNKCLTNTIVHFGGFCTGEVVSDKGLVFTNHHCGYNNIASLSTVEHNYLKDGFWAKSFKEEIPAPGLWVNFLVKVEDVTKEVMEGTKPNSPTYFKDRNEAFKVIAKKYSENGKYKTVVKDMFKGNQYIVFVYEQYNDVRFVGTPTESIGKFGGDTDNWMWPRHTGDFSVFRIYASKENKPATFSTENVPFSPKNHLKVSIKGVKEGDYTMILGYPGRTNRYETSYGVQLAQDVVNPAVVKLREQRLAYMLKEMQKDPATKIKLAGQYANIANYWKYFIGQTEQLKNLKVYEEKMEKETEFKTWAKDKTEYNKLFDEFSTLYNDYKPYALQGTYLSEGIMGSSVAKFSLNLLELETLLAVEKQDADKIKAAKEEIKADWKAFMNGTDINADKNIMAFVTQAYFKDIPADQHPKDFFGKVVKNPTEAASYTKYVGKMFEKTSLLDEKKFNDFIDKLTKESLAKEPVFVHTKAFYDNFNNNFSAKINAFNEKNYLLGMSYIKGMTQMNPASVAYPDANGTMRITNGNVKTYQPKDGIIYNYYCTLGGQVNKYKKGDYEFDLPTNLIEKAKAKDFGQYIDKTANDVVMAFICTTDITGGNSGSPVLDADGNLIGLAYDGNWEAMSGDIKFDTRFKRTICLDVRYLLWCMDKLGGATNLVNELQLVK